MDKNIAQTGEAVGSVLSKYKGEFLMLIAVLVMVGGYVFSAFMYMDMCKFMEAQTKAQIETAHVLSEMNVRLSELEMEHRVQGLKSGDMRLDSPGKK